MHYLLGRDIMLAETSSSKKSKRNNIHSSALAHPSQACHQLLKACFVVWGLRGRSERFLCVVVDPTRQASPPSRYIFVWPVRTGLSDNQSGSLNIFVCVCMRESEHFLMADTDKSPKRTNKTYRQKSWILLLLLKCVWKLTSSFARKVWVATWL